MKYGKVLLVIITCLSIFLVGCNKQDGIVVEGDYYSIERQNGNYYMNFTIEPAENVLYCFNQDFMRYDNVDVMASELLEHKLARTVVEIIFKEYADKKDRIQIVNVEELYEPSIDGWNVGKVTWRPDSYIFSIDNGDINAAFAVCTKESFESGLAICTKINEYTINGVKYTTAKHYGESYPKNSTQIKIYGEQDGVYFDVIFGIDGIDFTDFELDAISEEMLTNDFISQFRLKKHD